MDQRSGSIKPSRTSSIKSPSERSFTNPLKRSNPTWTASCNIIITTESTRENIARAGRLCRPSRMEGHFINNMFLKTQRRENSHLKSVKISQPRDRSVHTNLMQGIFTNKPLTSNQTNKRRYFSVFHPPLRLYILTYSNIPISMI